MKTYWEFSKLALRTPIFPLDLYKQDLQYFLDQPFFQHALAHANPVFYGLIEHKHSTSLSQKEILTTYKYILRSIFRSTPFALLAANTMVNWGRRTAFVLDTPHFRMKLDQALIQEIYHQLMQQDVFRKSLSYFPNPTLYQLGNGFRYYQKKLDTFSVEISQVEETELIEELIDKFTKGANYDVLKSHFILKGYHEKDASEIVDQLIAQNIMLSELQPDAFELRMLCKLKEKVSDIPALDKIRCLIDCIIEMCDHPVDLARLPDIKSRLNATFNIDNKKQYFHLDTYRDTSSSLNKSLQKQIARALDFLKSWHIPEKPVELVDFMHLFQEVYGEVQQPLLEVLDPTYGIGYSVNRDTGKYSLVSDLDFNDNTRHTLPLNNRDLLLLELVERSADKSTIDISNLINHIQTSDVTLPKSFSAVFRIIDFKKHQILIDAIGNSSALNMISRFSENKSFNKHFKEIIEHELKNNSEEIIAEVNYMPHNKLANVLLRSNLREFSILTSSGGKGANLSIPLNDLLVSVQNNQVILHSRSLEKQIIPKLSSAYNYKISELPPIRFLGDLQHQGISPGISFKWPSIFAYRKRLPRVCLGDKIVLLPAQWNFTQMDISTLKDSLLNFNLQLIQNFRKQWKMPQMVVLSEYDQELLIDFNNALSVKCWLQTVKSKPHFTLKEFLFDPETPIRDQHGRKYHHEFVCSVFNHKYNTNQPATNTHFHQNSKKFIPGSKWIYWKLYGNPELQNTILLDHIYPLIENEKSHSIIGNWFFLRYNDSGDHLRIRIEAIKEEYIGSLLSRFRKLFESLIAKKLIWKVCMDTYQPEYFRYHPQYLPLSHQIFTADSQNILGVLMNHSLTNNPELVGLKVMHCYLSTLQFELSEKLDFTTKMKNRYFQEFQISKLQKLNIDKKYRKLQKQIIEILEQENEIDGHFRAFIFPLIRKLIDLTDLEKIELLESYMHMSINRLIYHQPREHEMILYVFLCKYYKFKLAINKKSEVCA